ncbi:MAG: hypothetical protein IEMM0008_0036 [bacterium]|nr:MAG: hypothetical protein IEMM0008_0036 [bacterium]
MLKSKPFIIIFYFMLIVLSEACGASFVIDNVLNRLDDEVAEVNLDESQSEHWQGMKIRMKASAHMVVKQIAKNLITVKDELNKTNPDVDRIIAYLKKQFRKKPSILEIQLDYYKEFHDILRVDQKVKLFSMTRYWLNRILVQIKKKPDSVSDQTISKLDSILDELNLNSIQAKYWKNMKIRIRRQDKRHVKELTKYLITIKGELKKKEPDVTKIITYILKHSNKKPGPMEEQLDYYMELNDLLYKDQRVKAYSIIRKKLNRIIEFLQK